MVFCILRQIRYLYYMLPIKRYLPVAIQPPTYPYLTVRYNAD